MDEIDATLEPADEEGPIEVFGWASDNYSDGGPPAVIVHPEASALTLLSWGLGQLEQCNAMLDALMCANGSGGLDDAAQLAGSVRQFSVQAETVLRAGVAKLRAARK